MAFSLWLLLFRGQFYYGTRTPIELMSYADYTLNFVSETGCGMEYNPARSIVDLQARVKWQNC